MKPFVVSFSISCMLMLAIASCTSYSVEERKTDYEKESLQALLLEKGTTPITADEAINVARLFDINQGRPQTKAETDISDVYTLNNEEGMPVFYAVNRVGNAGFVIVSASRNYFPVLAYVEKGHFGEDYAKYGIANWVDRQIITVTAIEKESLRNESIDFSALWSIYEKSGAAPFVATKSEAEAFALRQASVAAWEAQGYTCYALMDCPSDLPSATYNAWCTSAASIANPNYDYMLYSVILERRVDAISTTGPLIGTTWEQDNGYNSAVPYYYQNGDHVDLGCTTVAAGQIMRYFQKPSTYNWSSMYLNTATSTTAAFLYSLGCNIGINYSTGFVGAYDYEVRNALQYYGYTVSYNDYSYSTVKSNIESGKPVYIGGQHYYPNGRQSGHAWVCEGYRYATFYYEYELKVLSVVEPLQYEHLGSTQSSQIGSTNYLYYNLGMGENLNGWYYAGDEFSNLDGSFENEKMIYNITPPVN